MATKKSANTVQAYRVTTPIESDGIYYAVGDELVLDDKQAEQLLELAAIAVL